jgi:hypothetical protein
MPGSGSLMHHAAHWRQRAQNQRELAELVDSPEIKAAILKTAEEYERLALRAEGREPPPNPS